MFLRWREWKETNPVWFTKAFRSTLFLYGMIPPEDYQEERKNSICVESIRRGGTMGVLRLGSTNNFGGLEEISGRRASEFWSGRG